MGNACAQPREKYEEYRSKWTGSTHDGTVENHWFQGKGRYVFPNDTVYEGEFDKGEFHGNGTLIYPNGVSANCLGSLCRQVGKRQDDRRQVLLL